MHWSRKGKVLLRICGKRADGEGKHGARRVVVVSVRVSQRVVVVVLLAEQGSHRLTVGCALFVPAQNAHGDLRVRVAELKGRGGGRGPETGHGSAAKQEQAAKAVQAHTPATWGGGTTSGRGSWPSCRRGRIYLGPGCRMERRGAVWWPPLRKEFLPSCLGWEGGPCGAGPVRRRFVGQD